MMGQRKDQPGLFSYRINLEHQVRSDHPLRRVAETVDFRFVREEVASFYGSNGNESVDPQVIVKMMFLLFFEDIKSERELMRIIPERLDYLWFRVMSFTRRSPITACFPRRARAAALGRIGENCGARFTPKGGFE